MKICSAFSWIVTTLINYVWWKKITTNFGFTVYLVSILLRCIIKKYTNKYNRSPLIGSFLVVIKRVFLSLNTKKNSLNSKYRYKRQFVLPDSVFLYWFDLVHFALHRFSFRLVDTFPFDNVDIDSVCLCRQRIYVEI